MINVGDGIVWSYEDDNKLHEQLGLEPREPEYFRVYNIRPIHGEDIGIVTLESVVDGNTNTWLYLRHLEYAIQRNNILHIPREPIVPKQMIKQWRPS